MRKILHIILVISILIPAGFVYAYGDNADYARNFIDMVSQQALNTIQEDGSDNTVKHKLSVLFEENVDIEWIAKFVLGNQYGVLKNAEFQRFYNVYHTYLINRYVPKFKSYNGQKYNIVSSKPLGNDYYKVVTNIADQTRSNNTIDVEYRVKLFEGNKAKIRDITVEGISLILTQRTDFTSFLQNDTIDNLIIKLQQES